MTKTQMLIDEMHNGNTNVIIENISNQTPIIILNAIMAGTKFGIKTPAFLDGVTAAEKSDAVLLGIPLSKFATASLHLLKQKEYKGSDSTIVSMIESKFAI